jgi:hypothetical protein
MRSAVRVFVAGLIWAVYIGLVFLGLFVAYSVFLGVCHFIVSVAT